jgi:hypothetical protein
VAAVIDHVDGSPVGPVGVGVGVTDGFGVGLDDSDSDGLGVGDVVAEGDAEAALSDGDGLDAGFALAETFGAALGELVMTAGVPLLWCSLLAASVRPGLGVVLWGAGTPIGPSTSCMTS